MLEQILNSFPNQGQRGTAEMVDANSTNNWNLPSHFQTSEFAANTILASGIMLAEYCHTLGYKVGTAQVDRRLASLWFDQSYSPIGWEMPPIWDAIAGNYETQDGWIRLHTNAAHHREAALKVLDCQNDRNSVSQAVARWNKGDLETEIVNAKGCAAAMYSQEEWNSHPSGSALDSEPLIQWRVRGESTPMKKKHTQNRPLDGIRVLDLTRVLAGPTSTRFLAAYGADVLRIDPPLWDDSSLLLEMTIGKRCAGLDLNKNKDRETFELLLRNCDVLVHGYRSDALDRLGYDQSARLTLNPHLIDVALNAYGWSGPWKHRRGFDSLVQMSCGISHYGMQQSKSDQPVPLPVQALDYGTGYLMSAAVLYALAQRQRSGSILAAKLSLARSAKCLMNFPTTNYPEGQPLNNPIDADFNENIETTMHGEIKRLRFPLQFDGLQAAWTHPVSELRSFPAAWS